MAHDPDVIMMDFSVPFPAIIVSCLFAFILSSFFFPSSGLAVNTGSQRLVATHGKKSNPLDACIHESIQSGLPTILIVDSNNVRGKDDFKTWNCDLLQRLSSYRRDQKENLHLIYAIDHGCRSQIFEYPDGLIVFAGPHRTADDIIVQATRYFVSQDLSSQLVVVTSDGELKQRCLRQADGGGKYKRKKLKGSSGGGVKVFGSPSLVSLLKGIQVEVSQCQNFVYEELSRVESDIRWYTTLHPPYQSGYEQVEAEKHGLWQSDIVQQDCLNAMFPRITFQEKTWHRVVVAELMQRLLQTKEPESSTSQLLVHYKDFYQQHQVDNHFGSPVDTMFLDHRLRCEPYLQQQLLRYFQASVLDDNPNEKDKDPLPFKSPSQLAVEFMQELVQESSCKSQEEILARYRNEAPVQLQTSRGKDLLELLQKVAVRERRDDDTRPRWHLLEISDYAGFQPQRGRRSEKRRQAQLDNSDDDIDEGLIATGAFFESEWLERVKVALKLC